MKRTTVLLAVFILSIPATKAGSVTNFSITFRGPGGSGPYTIQDNDGDRDKNPAANVIQFDDPGAAAFDSQFGFFGIGGMKPKISATATDNSLEVVLTDLSYSNFANPTVVSLFEFNLTWNNVGGPGTFAESLTGSWALPFIADNAPRPLPTPPPVRGVISQAGEGGGTTVFDSKSDSNVAGKGKSVALALANGPKAAQWEASALVYGNVQFDVSNVVPFTEGTHTVEIPGSAHWLATVAAVPVPETSTVRLLSAALFAGLFLRYRKQRLV